MKCSAYRDQMNTRLDLTNEDSIRTAAAEVEAKLGGRGIDVLINKSGVG